jgi:hypothetical protein
MFISDEIRNESLTEKKAAHPGAKFSLESSNLRRKLLKL